MSMNRQRYTHSWIFRVLYNFVETVLNKNGFLFDINRLTELLCFLLGEQNYAWSKQNEKRDKQRLSHRITL